MYTETIQLRSFSTTLLPYLLLILAAQAPAVAQTSMAEENIRPSQSTCLHNDPKAHRYNILSDPLDDTPQPFDVLHYGAYLDLRKAPEKEMSGVCNIQLVWKSATDPVFTFHLRSLSIDSVFYNQVPVSYQTIGEESEATYRHTVTPPTPPSEGDTAIITVHYHGTMTDEYGSGRWGGVSSGNGVLYAMGVGFMNNYVSTTQHWLPCYDHPADKATFTGSFRIPNGMRVASNGLLSAETPLDSNTTLFVWEHNYPAATYLLTFAVASYATLDIGTGELPMLLFAKPEDTAKTRESFTLLPQMVATYAGRYGDYPFEKVGYVNTPQGAMEHQTMISYPTGLARSGDSLDLVIPHELAHQWFGDFVSPIDFRHAWLNESFATFSESVWMEELFGYDSYLATQESKLYNYLQRIAPQEGALPLYDFSRTSPSSNYPATIYDKGAVVVGMLRFELGESRFFQAMQTYLERYAYGNAGTDSLLAVCEEITGKDFDLFFDQWIRRGGWPIYQITVANPEEPDVLQITIEQMQPTEYGTFTNVPLELSFVTPQGIVNRLYRIDSVKETFEVNISSVLDVMANSGPLLRTLADIDMQVTLGTDDRQEMNGVTYEISPNPVQKSGGVTIERKGPPSSIPTLLYVFDSSGRLAFSTTIDNFPYRFDSSTFSSGHYIFSLSQENARQTFPVFIQH